MTKTGTCNTVYTSHQKPSRDELPGMPPQKRARNDSTEDPRIRSEYWFHDGNIVLEAEDTLFRVHQSVLSRQSQIFEDAFSIAQGIQGNKIEGCAVIKLSDTAEDMVNLISLLYDTQKVLNVSENLHVRVLGSMLRLGRKYHIAHLENKALQVLHHDYPTTLQDWDSFPARRQIKLGDEPDFQTTVEVISIAHEFHLCTILPAAYARYIGQVKLLKFMANDGCIPEKARERCLLGYARILEFLKDKHVDAFCPPFIPSTACSSQGKCEAKKWQTIKSLSVWSTKEPFGFGIFDLKYPRVKENLCVQCRTEAKKLIDKVRSDFWSILPSFFDLPAWTDLKDEI